MTDPEPTGCKTSKRPREAQETNGSGPICSSRKRPNLGRPTPSLLAAQAVEQTHFKMLESLAGKYQVEKLSVISSSSMKNRVDSIMRHVSQFHPTDMNILPGVVLLHAKVSYATKLFGIIEIAKRRIHEMDQKWYQYNRLNQVQVTMKFPADEDLSRVDDTMLPATAEKDDDGSDGYGFEPLPTAGTTAAATTTTTTVQAFSREQQQRQITQHSSAADPAARPHLSISVFLSRVPIPEFNDKPDYTMQTNEVFIQSERARRMGLPPKTRFSQSRTLG